MLHWMPSKSPQGGGQLKEQFNRSTFQKTLKSIRHRNCGTRAIPGFWGMPLQMIQMLVSIATRLVWVVRRLSRSPTAECVCAWGYDILPYPVAQALEDGRHKVSWSLQIICRRGLEAFVVSCVLAVFSTFALVACICIAGFISPFVMVKLPVGLIMQQRNFARGHDDPPLAVGGPAQVHLHEWLAVP